MHIEYVGRDAIVETEQMAFTYKVSDSPREFENYRPKQDELNWNNRTSFIGDFLVYPFGNNNDFPDMIREVVQNNYLAPGILKKKTQLLWGSGPKLYKEIIEGRKVIKDWQDNPEVQAWLDTWDYEAYLLEMCTDYQHMEGVFTRFEQKKGSRIGKSFIHQLHHIPPHKARLASDKGTKDYIPSHVIVNDWSLSHPASLLDYKAYHKFDFNRPFAFPNAVLYSNMASFCTDYYTVPDIYGSLEWLRLSTATPLILKAFAKNGINLKYHIISPQAYWDEKEERMKENCTKTGQEYKESMLRDYETKLLKSISNVLSGVENTGKFLHTKESLEVDGTNLLKHGWRVEVIDQKVKDFIEGQIMVSQRADRAVSGGIGLHGALGNVAESGKSDSGSEQLYALKNYMATGVDIPEMIVMKALNYALKANFPKLGLKMGFYHIQPEKEQDVNPEDRLKNVV